MTKQETIQVLKSIEDRAVNFTYMTACDWVAIAAAKRHLENSLETKEVDLEKEIGKYLDANDIEFGYQIKLVNFAKHFFELGLNASIENLIEND